MEKLLLIDGSSMLSSAYYGSLPKSVMFEKDPEKKKEHYKDILQTKNGVYTNAMFSMLRTVLKIIKEQKPSHIAFAFDKSRNTIRRKIYPEYKANRGETPEPLKEQFINMEKLLSQIGFQVFISDEYEADDLIYSLAKKFEDRIPVAVMTKDNDYLQMISNNTSAWIVQTKQEKTDELFRKYGTTDTGDIKKYNLPDKVFEFTDKVLFSEYGIHASQFADWKALVGDTSDNIPGVKGISSAASVLINHYGSIEELYEAIDMNTEQELEQLWTSFGIRKGNYKKLTVYGARQSAFLSKRLAKLIEVPLLVNNLDSFQCVIRRQGLIDICNLYEFHYLKEKYKLS